MKSKLRKLLFSIIFVYAQLFPSSGIIIEHKSVQELEDDDEIQMYI